MQIFVTFLSKFCPFVIRYIQYHNVEYDTDRIPLSAASSAVGGISPTPSMEPAAPLPDYGSSGNVETVVTRTERYVHHAEDTAEPVVDERVTEQVFRDGEEVRD